MKTNLTFAGAVILAGLLAGFAEGAEAQGTANRGAAQAAPPVELFFTAAARDSEEAQKALTQIAARWQPGYAGILLDLMYLTPGTARQRLADFLGKQTGRSFGNDVVAWNKWLWRQPHVPHPDHLRFKRELYSFIDERMARFFPDGARSLIRLDEIVWGGVRVNGIPPLDYPKHIAAKEADWLKDEHIVFGIHVNGEARAYPKRILAWHELARDRIGGVELTIVYCTLCGTVIPYESIVGGKLRRLGTSGLLYRSNKLMFDEETWSLWSTLEGKPVVGALAGLPLRLKTHSAVTTTWGEWRATHPDTAVLSLETGHQRDYGEGAAYRNYFATDDLMFEVPADDRRLKNKAEVLVMRLEPAGGGAALPVAISAEFLRKNRIYHAEFAGRKLVVLTTEQGANRVYETGKVQMKRFRDGNRVEDSSGRLWRVAEGALVAEGHPAGSLARTPAQRAFWFGWHAQFPETLLVQ